MTWGDEIAARLLGSTVPAGFDPALAIWESPVTVCPLIALADLKAALGIVDTSQDDELTRLIDVYSTSIGDYIERQLCEGAREVVYVPLQRLHYSAPWITLPQYPVSSIEHWDLDGAVLDQDGLDALVIDGNQARVIATAGAGWQIGQYLHVKYTAGYNPVPADMQDAMIQLCGTAITSSVGSSETGPLKSQRVEGAVSETYYDPRSGTTTGTTSTSAGGISRYYNTLDRYRSERCFI